MSEEDKVRSLYEALLQAWNQRDADAYGALFAEDGFVVGFDGSSHEGPAGIRSDLGRIFADHPTAAYVAKVRRVLLLSPDVAVLRAVAGMVLPGQSELEPAVNTVQTLVAAKHGDRWRVALFQNTPAAFHGRPELSEQLTEELSRVFRGADT